MTSDLENDLREKNIEMAQKIQQLKMIAAERENDNLKLMKENNELRLKLVRLRNAEAAHTRKLDVDLQAASEQALSLLVKASTAVASILDYVKTYVQDKENLESSVPRWSNISTTPSTERINRVPPMLFGGRDIQPVVSLSRLLQTNNSQTINGTSNQQNNNLSERALPMRMLQEVLIPLTRIDAELRINNADADGEVNIADDNSEDLASDNGEEIMMDESQNLSNNDFDQTQRLDPLTEDIEPEDVETPALRSEIDNPLEGPSWLLDRPNSKCKSNNRMNLEPDSTTEFSESVLTPATPEQNHIMPQQDSLLSVTTAFTPTMRRRKRPSTPPPVTPRSPLHSPRPAHPSRRNSTNGRILKVLVAKMRLGDEQDGGGDACPQKKPNHREAPPPKSIKMFHTSRRDGSSAQRSSAEDSPQRWDSPIKRPMRFDAPSPNGSTDSRVIVLETKTAEPVPCSSGVPKSRTDRRTDSREHFGEPNRGSRDCEDDSANASRRGGSHRSVESDSSESDIVSKGRSRRPRKAITYKERPLNRKLRR